MTKGEVLAMEAGINLDCKIHREVMQFGDVPIKVFPMCLKENDPASPTIPILAYEVGEHSEEFEWKGWTEVPRYSTNIPAAWQVVEKMKSNGVLFTRFTSDLMSLLTASETEPLLICVDLLAKLTPEAVCKAALLTKIIGGER